MSCSRASLKRSRDVFDSSSIASSTPPQRLTKRYHLDSDASFDGYTPFHQPSDSPTNPFGRIKTFSPRSLPHSTPSSGHLILRFQLGQQAGNVHRIACVPDNYTFWHLAKLTQFLFGWKDTKKQRNPYNRLEKIERRVEHVFTVQKRVVFYASAKHAGLFKEGRTVVHVAENIKKLRPYCEDEAPWEHEERYTLRDLWHYPGRYNETSRAIIFEYDVLSSLKDAVYITIYNDTDKLNVTQADLDDLSNVPFVLQGQGLPDDDEDDDDFPLDLQQWNEPGVFEKYLQSQGVEEEEDERPASVRLAEEQALVQKRMTAPLPDKLPIDEEDIKDPEVEDEPPKHRMLTSYLAKPALKSEPAPAPVNEERVVAAESPSAADEDDTNEDEDANGDEDGDRHEDEDGDRPGDEGEDADADWEKDDRDQLELSPVKKQPLPSRLFQVLEGNKTTISTDTANPFRRKSITTLSEFQKPIHQKTLLANKLSAPNLAAKAAAVRTAAVEVRRVTSRIEVRRERDPYESEGEV